MKLLDGPYRDKYYLELSKDEMILFYLILAAGFSANPEQWAVIERHYRGKNPRDWVARVMEIIKRKFQL